MAEKFLMTALSPTMEEGVIAKWLKKEGDKVEEGDVLCEVETDKATVEYEATFEGVILKILLSEGKSAKVGDAIGIVGEAGEDFKSLLDDAPVVEVVKKESKQTIVQNKAVKESSSKGTFSTRIRISPMAKKLAENRGIDLEDLRGKGTGPGGRIIKVDVQNFKGPIVVSSTSQDSVSAPVAKATATPRVIVKLEDKIIPIAGKRKVIAQRLSDSLFSSPHYYLSKSVNMETVIKARTTINNSLKDMKVSFNAILMKFAAEAIKKHPMINSSWQGDKIIQYGNVDIGLAVDINGLITPIVRNVESKGIIEIEQELKTLIEKTKKNTLQPSEYSGATFSISSLGGFGVDEFTAIINPPGAAILAVGATIKTPVVSENGEVVVKPMAKYTLSADHRVIDGKVSGMFLVEFAKMLEDPIRALF